MIQKFVERFEKHKAQLEKQFSEKHPDEYKDIVKAVVKILVDDSEYPTISPRRIHEINDGKYQGTLVYLIADDSYQPSHYWYVLVDYGSCTGCDTLEAIKGYHSYDRLPTEQQVKDYMTLALHIVQSLKELDNNDPA